MSDLLNFRNLFSTKISKYRLIEILIPLIFILIGFFGALNHSLWRDEMQGWMVAWRSNSLKELWLNNAPSGHPVLWSMLIYMVKNSTANPLSMSILHWALGSFAVVLFWAYSPFTKLQKVLFTFGYFPFWEYYFVSRHYVIAEVLIFIFCVTYRFRRKTYILASLCIGLLANTHALAWSLSFACAITLLFEFFSSSSQRRQYLSNKFWRLDLLMSIVLTTSLIVFATVSLFVSRNPFDFYGDNTSLIHLLKVIGQFLGGYLLIIPNDDRLIDLLATSSVSICLFSYISLSIRDSKKGLVFFIAGTAFLLVINYLFFGANGLRYQGFYFLIFISSLWLKESDKVNEINAYDINLVKSASDNKNYLWKRLLPFLLTIHLFYGLHMVLTDFRLPYSSAKAAATYIEKNNWQNLPIFATRDVETSTISGYLDKDFYYPELKGYGSYVQWKNRSSISNKDILKELKLFLSNNSSINEALVIISKNSLLEELKSGQLIIEGNLQIRSERSFEKSFHDSEKYFLYWAKLL